MTRDVQPVLDLLARLPASADADGQQSPDGAALATLLRSLSENNFDLMATIAERPDGD